MMRLAGRLLLLAAAFCAPRLAVAQSEQIHYYHTDAIGSVRMITDANGQIVLRHDYLPFGEKLGAPDFRDPRMFAGKERDAETEFDYFGGRYYQFTSGRFTTVDPVYNQSEHVTDPQRWNRYLYVTNRPLRLVDPDGRTPWDLLDYVSFAASASELLENPTDPWKWVAAGADALGAALPVVPAPGTFARIIRSAGVAEETGEFFSRSGFRRGVERALGSPSVRSHAHHVFALKFAGRFRAAGINVNDPRLGSWWEAVDHLKNARGYNLAWQQFLQANPHATKQEILEFGRLLAGHYGIKVQF